MSTPWPERERKREGVTKEVGDARRNVSDQVFLSLAAVHLDLDDPFLVPIPEEGVAVCLPVDRDPRPSELLDGDERLVDVSVLGDEVGGEVQAESLCA